MELELADSTIKLLRLLGNLCIEEGVGEKIAANSDIIEVCKFLSLLASPWSCCELAIAIFIRDTYFGIKMT